MEQQEEYALLLAEKTIRNKMHTLLDLNNINDVFPSTPNGQAAITMINSGEYRLDYAFISFDYDEFEKILQEFNNINKTNRLKKKRQVAVIGITDKTKHSEERISSAKNLGIEFLIERSLLNMENLEKLILSVKENISKNMTIEDKKKERYTFIKNLGSGEFGIVDLCKDNIEDKYVAVKKISLEGMNQAGKNKVKQEVDLLSKVKAPTIIDFFSSTVENDTRFIYLEYAKEGTLENVIRDYRLKGNKIPTEQTIDWLIQILIALFSLNKNNMMHRDIKTENMLITEDKILKLSDLGISKVIDEQNKTLCGTPYYVSPEIASGLDYDFNTDIWSLGIVVYEIITGIKPFDKANPSDLYISIQNDDYIPLPPDTDPKLIFLVSFMLRKNPKKRANLDDLLECDFIYYRMIQIIELNNWKDKIPFVEKIYEKEKCLKTYFEYSKILSEENRNILFDCFIIFEGCSFTPYKKSFISPKINNAITGDNIYNSFCDSFKELKIHGKNEPRDFFSDNEEDEEMALNYLVSCVEKNLIIPLSDEKDNLSFSNDAYYLFSFNDIYNQKEISNFKIFANLNIPKHSDLLIISQFVLSEGIFLYEKILSDSINREDVLFSDIYYNFICGLSEFQNLKIMNLKFEERILSLLNIYQIMIIHQLINVFLQKKQINSGGIFSFLKNKVAMNYQFEDMTLNNLEIKHVIFRNNKKPPNNYVRLCSTNDIKTQILPDYSDLRPLLMLYDIEDESIFDNGIPEAYLRYKFQVFERKDFDNQLNEIAVNFINSFISYTEDSIIIPNFINTYIPDFGTQVNFIKFIFKIYIANDKKQNIFKIKTIKENEFDFLSNMSLLLRRINNKTITIIIGE
jgi:NIMA (never in mitosis gene a)-related kinase